MTNVFDAKFVGLPVSKPALLTVSIWAVSAEANTSAVAPCASWVARSEEPANSNSTPRPGFWALNCWPIWVNAGLSDAAANTVTLPDAWEGCAEGDFELHPIRPAVNTMETTADRIPTQRMYEP